MNEEQNNEVTPGAEDMVYPEGMEPKGNKPSKLHPEAIAAIVATAVIVMGAAFYYMDFMGLFSSDTEVPAPATTESDYLTSDEFTSAYNDGNLDAIIAEADELLKENSNDVGALLVPIDPPKSQRENL